MFLCPPALSAHLYQLVFSKLLERELGGIGAQAWKYMKYWLIKTKIWKFVLMVVIEGGRAIIDWTHSNFFKWKLWLQTWVFDFEWEIQIQIWNTLSISPIILIWLYINYTPILTWCPRNKKTGVSLNSFHQRREN